MADKEIYWYGRSFKPFVESNRRTEAAKALTEAYKKAMAALRYQHLSEANIRPDELELRLEVRAIIRGREDDEQPSGVVS